MAGAISCEGGEFFGRDGDGFHSVLMSMCTQIYSNILLCVFLFYFYFLYVYFCENILSFILSLYDYF